MSIPVPNTVQTALLFDDAMILDLHAFAERFQREQDAAGVHFNLVETAPDHTFVRLYGTNELMITIEQVLEPLKPEPFRGVLDSAYIDLISPKASDKVAAHRSGALITVSHGVMPDDETANNLLNEVGFPQAGQSQKEFLLRLEALSALTRAYGEQREPVLLHWTQSNQLLTFETFLTLSAEPQPNLLNIHPQLYSDKTDAQGQWVGFRTFGAEHFLGREITFKSAPVAWSNLYEYALIFLRFSASENGYVVPHGDTFGDGEGLSIAVRHVPAGENGPAVYELTLLQSAKLGYECAPDLVPDLEDDGASPVPDLDPNDPMDLAILQKLAERGDTTIQRRYGIALEDEEEPESVIAQSSGGFGRRQSPPAS